MKPTDSTSLSHNYNFWVLLYWQYVTGITVHCKLMLQFYSTVPDKQFTQTLQEIKQHCAERSHKVKKGKVHPCTGTEALYRPYDP